MDKAISAPQLSRSVESMDPLVNIDVYRVIGMNEVPGVEQRADRLDVVCAQGVAEYGAEVFDALGRGPEPDRVVERRGERSEMNVAPEVEKLVGVDAVEGETAVAVLKCGNAVVHPFEQEVDGLAAQFRGVEPVEQDRPAPPLGVAHLADKDGRVSTLVAALAGKELVADPLDQDPLDRVGGARILDVAGRIFARDHGAQVVPLVVDYPLRHGEHGMFLDVEQRQHALDQGFGVDWRLGYKDDVGLPERRAERDHATVAAHDFDDRDPAVAFGGRADALDADRRNVNRGGVSGCHVIDHLVEAEVATGPLAVNESFGASVRLAAPFHVLVAVVEAEVVVNRLWRKHHRQVGRQGLHRVERAVAPNADEAVDLEPFETFGDLGDDLGVVRVNVVA